MKNNGNAASAAVPDRFEIAIWGDDELRLCAGQACHKATAVEGVLAWQELSTRTDPAEVWTCATTTGDLELLELR